MTTLGNAVSPQPLAATPTNRGQMVFEYGGRIVRIGSQRHRKIQIWADKRQR